MNQCGQNPQTFPPFIVEGEGILKSIRLIYLKYCDVLSYLLVFGVFMNFLICCRQSTVDTFRNNNLALSVVITFDIVCKILLINALYFNKYYYGGLTFIVMEFVSGPLCLTLNLVFIINKTHYAAFLADVMIIMRIFSIKRMRALLLDICYIVSVSRQIIIAFFLVFYVYSYLAFSIFQDVGHKKFKNLFFSMVSMLQVLTQDSWNPDVNISVSSQFGYIWSFFFVFFILFMSYYLTTLLLGAFVSYYSNPDLRIHYDYDYGHDDILNPALLKEKRQTLKISEALKILKIDHNDQDKHEYQWGLGHYHRYIYSYIFVQIASEIFKYGFNNIDFKKLYFLTEFTFGIIFCYVCIIKIQQYRQIKITNFRQRNQQIQESFVRIYTIILLIIAGPLATSLDIQTIFNGSNQFVLKHGPGARVLITLAVDSIQKIICKFLEIFPGVLITFNIIKISHIILFIGGLLFSLALLARQFITPLNINFDPPILMTDMTQIYLYLLQVITFDCWADQARLIIQKSGFLSVVYFMMLIIFIGFFLINMLIGIIATITQPKTQELFEKRSLLRQRVNKAGVNHLKTFIDKNQQYQIEKDQPHIMQLKEILNQFNSSTKSNDKMFVYVNGQRFEVTTKGLLIFRKNLID